jgi:autotransporter-associated beta strand protein
MYRNFALLCIGVILGFGSGSTSLATDGTWNGASGGAWSNPGNWVGGLIANGTDATANFFDFSGSVRLDSPRTIGYLNVSSSHVSLNDNGNAANRLTMQTSTGFLFPPEITVNNGSLNIGLGLSGGITKRGGGPLVLDGFTANTGLSMVVTEGLVSLVQGFGNAIGVGGLTVAGGIVQIGLEGDFLDLNRIHDSANVTVTSGILSVVASETFNSLSLHGTIWNFSNGPVVRLVTNSIILTGNSTVDVTAASGELSINAPIGGSFGITKVGTGTLTLLSNNSFTGGLTVAEGTVAVHSGTLPGTVTNQASVAQNGGNISGQLVNQGSFIFNGGTFAGRLVNHGSATFNTTMFTAGNGLANHTSMTVGTGFTLTLNGAGLDNQGTFTLDGGMLAVSNMTGSGNFLFDRGTLTANQAGGNLNAAIVSNTVNTTINVSANNVSLGNAASFSGFNHLGTFNIGANSVTLRSAGYARLGILTTLTGGTISAPNGVAFATGSNFLGRGALNARVSGDEGSIIEANGTLALGDAASPAGYVSSGELRTRQFAVTLNSAAQATLGNLTTLGSGASAGTLNAANGLVVDFGHSITGFGTIGSTNTLAKRTIINGIAQGNSAAQPLTFSGYVKGVGTFNNVMFTGTFDPGLSTTRSTVGSIGFGSTNTLLMELGGTGRGSQYDAILASGNLSLDGTLAVSLINGFTPVAGNSFDLLDWGTRGGTFDLVQLPTLTSGLTWNTAQLYTTGVISVTGATGLRGDFNRDGTVDAFDIDLLAAAAHNDSHNLFYDLNDDGSVTFRVDAPTPSDSDVLIREFLHTEYGDLNLDGQVFLSDLSTFAMNYRQAGLFGWAQGNIDGNQEPGTTTNPRVFLADLSALATHWRFGVGRSGAGAAVPEPTSALPAVCGILAVFCRRRNSWNPIGRGRLRSLARF